MEKTEIYSLLATTPQEARKPIKAGRLAGFTDINPMWRIKRLTEVFGPFGIGWYYTPKKREFIPGASGEIACFVDIDLFYKDGDQWSQAVPGNGGSMLVANERNGLHTSDEAVKMATTDAIGSACKLLGMSADIYYEKDRTKYNCDSQPPRQEPSKQEAPKREPSSPQALCSHCHRPIQPVMKKDGSIVPVKTVIENSTKEYGEPLCLACCKAMAAAKKMKEEAK